MMERRIWFVILGLSSLKFVQHSFRRILPPLIPVLVVQTDLALWQLGLFVGMYSTGFGVGQIPAGMLADKYDRRLLLGAGLVLLPLGHGVFAFTPLVAGDAISFQLAGQQITELLVVSSVAMFVSGLGGATTIPAGYSLITTSFDESYTGRALGVWSSAGKAGDAFAPIAIALLLFIFDWQLIILLFSAVGLVYAVGFFTAFPRLELRPAPTPETTDDSAESTSLLDGSTKWAFLLLVFVVSTRGIAIQGVYTFVPTFITDVYGYNLELLGTVFPPESLANFYFTALLIVAGVTQLFAGEMSDAYDPRAILIGLFALSTLGLFVLSTVFLSPFWLLVWLILSAIGLWGVTPSRDYLISEISPDQGAGRTFGYLWTIKHLLGAATPVVIGYIASFEGIQSSFRYLALSTALALLGVFLFYDRRVYSRS